MWKVIIPFAGSLLLAACTPRPSELWCGNRWKNPGYPGERLGIASYLPIGVNDTELDLVSRQCASGCCREPPKDERPHGSNTWVETGGIPRGVVRERVEVRGWVATSAGLMLNSPTRPAIFENEITFDLQPDLDWTPDPTSPAMPLNSLVALMRYTSPIVGGEGTPDAPPEFKNVMPPIRIHVEINGWGGRACLRPKDQSFEPKKGLCEHAKNKRPSNFGYEIFLYERDPKAAASFPGMDYEDCHRITDPNAAAALPVFSSWFPFDVLPANEIPPLGSAYCVLQRSPSGSVRSTWTPRVLSDTDPKVVLVDTQPQPQTIVEGKYVRLVGTLWEDGDHGKKSCWNAGGTFSSDRAWVEMHPVDELEFLAPPAYPRPGQTKGAAHPSCDGTPLAGQPNRTRCIVQLCSAEGVGAPAERKMAPFYWRPKGANPSCKYTVQEVVDNASDTGFTGCSSFLDGKCDTGRVTWDSTGTGFVLNAVAVGEPGKRRGIVRAGYEITADCSCKSQCAGRCGGPDGCGGTCSAVCPAGGTCNPTTRMCEAMSEIDCVGVCAQKHKTCTGACGATTEATCEKKCDEKHAACLNGCR